jgi:hypothetical protein
MPSGQLCRPGGRLDKGRSRMNTIIYLLFGFMILGLFSHRLGKSVYLIWPLLILGYVFYAYVAY